MTRYFSPTTFEPQADRRFALPRLTLSAIEQSRPDVRRPSFDRRRLRPGILHLGCGVFHRAHQAVFTQRAAELDPAYGCDWGIVGVSFRSAAARELLSPQDYLYSVVER